MISCTVLILTHNEQENIARTIAALPKLDDVVLIDSLSDDQTAAIATAANPRVRVIPRAFDSHTNQWNFGLDQVETEWALTLDADYELSAELRAEISALAPSDDTQGYSAEFIYRVCGHPLRASSYPPRVLLFRVKEARYVDDGHTQTLWFKTPSGELRPPNEVGKLTASPTVSEHRIGQLAGKIYHDDRKSVSHWIQAQDRYAILEAKHLLATPMEQLNFQDRLRRRIFFASPAMFLYLFFWRGLILDGWAGWFYVAQRTIAELLLSIRLLTEKHRLEEEKAIR